MKSSVFAAFFRSVPQFCFSVPFFIISVIFSMSRDIVHYIFTAFNHKNNKNMTNIDGVIIVLGLAYGIYKFYELSIRRKERMTLIEKMNTGNGGTLSPDAIRALPPSVQTFGALGMGLVFIGVGLGMCIAFIVIFCMKISHQEVNGEILYFSLMLLFGGIGLVIGYLMEYKKRKKD